MAPCPPIGITTIILLMANHSHIVANVRSYAGFAGSCRRWRIIVVTDQGRESGEGLLSLPIALPPLQAGKTTRGCHATTGDQYEPQMALIICGYSGDDLRYLLLWSRNCINSKMQPGSSNRCNIFMKGVG